MIALAVLSGVVLAAAWLDRRRRAGEKRRLSSLIHDEKLKALTSVKRYRLRFEGDPARHRLQRRAPLRKVG